MIQWHIGKILNVAVFKASHAYGVLCGTDHEQTYKSYHTGAGLLIKISLGTFPS